MKKLQLGKPARYALIGGGVALVIVSGVLTLSATARESVACNVTAEVEFSPGGAYRAVKAQKTCRWGLGPNTAEVQVEKQDKNGWTLVLPLESDGRAPAAASADLPGLKWRDEDTLEVTVYSRDLSGSLTRRMGDLTVTRRYVKAPIFVKTPKKAKTGNGA